MGDYKDQIEMLKYAVYLIVSAFIEIWKITICKIQKKPIPKFISIDPMEGVTKLKLEDNDDDGDGDDDDSINIIDEEQESTEDENLDLDIDIDKLIGAAIEETTQLEDISERKESQLSSNCTNEGVTEDNGINVDDYVPEQTTFDENEQNDEDEGEDVSKDFQDFGHLFEKVNYSNYEDIENDEGAFL